MSVSHVQWNHDTGRRDRSSSRSTAAWTRNSRGRCWNDAGEASFFFCWRRIRCYVQQPDLQTATSNFLPRLTWLNWVHSSVSSNYHRICRALIFFRFPSVTEWPLTFVCQEGHHQDKTTQNQISKGGAGPMKSCFESLITSYLESHIQQNYKPQLGPAILRGVLKKFWFFCWKLSRCKTKKGPSTT